MSFRQIKRFRSNKRENSLVKTTNYMEDEASKAGERPARHPPHLRGRDIGLFYAMRNKARKEEQKISGPKPIATILLSDSKKQEISRLLNADVCNTDVEKTSSYDHVKDSDFKRKFLKVIQGDIQEKLQIEERVSPNDEWDRNLLRKFLDKQSDGQYKSMNKKRQKLPSYDMKDEIVDIIERNQVCVISGETGCGKTTQVAQFILDHYINKNKGSACRIVCTQPRRISAIAIAHRVAEERAEKLGESVGFQIRLEKVLPRQSASITFCTTGVVLKQMETDPCLSTVSHLILDEIHERDIMSDFLISLLKKIIAQRRDMKLILMSATLNSEQFVRYYENCELIHIPGFTYHVEEYYLEDVLERTRFDFGDESNLAKKPPWYSRRYSGYSKVKNLKHFKFIEPHARQLEAEKKYSRHVTIQLRNPKSEELSLELILALLIDICCKEKESGAILVFLTGYADISKLSRLMEGSGKFPHSNYLILPLHSQMPSVDQRQIFDTPPAGVRKIILATNIAETSITVDDVVFVIDCGRIKVKNFDVETNIQSLDSQWVSLANANQRRGRAGRVKPGICFHLYSRARNVSLEKYMVPEILRTRLEDVVLTIKVLQLGKAAEFLASLLDQPDPKAVDLAVNLLKRLNALDDDENLTPLGYHLAKLPIGPQMGKMILLGAFFSCLDPILSVAASLDFKDAFQMPLGKEQEVDSRKLELSNGVKSDHLLLHYALRGFEEAGPQARRFCWDYFLSYHTLTLLQNMKKQFMEYLHEMDFVPNTDPKCEACNRNSENMSLVKAVICAGLYPNVAVARKMKRHRNFFYTVKQERVEMHARSVLCKAQYIESPLIVYYMRMKTRGDFLHDATVVHPLPLIFFGDKYEQNKDGGVNSITVNERLRFKCSESTAATIAELRNRLNWFLEYKVSHPHFVDWSVSTTEVKVLRAIMELITSEDVGDVDSDAFDDCD